MSMRSKTTLLTILLVAAAALSAPAMAVSLNESRPGLWGAAVTPDDEPLKGVKVTLTPNGVSAAPLTMTSNKRGQFIFPRLDLLDEGYAISVEYEGYFVREYHIRTRRGNREIYQDDEGKLVPQQQVFPPLFYRGGRSNATMTLVMVKIEDYEAELRARSAAEAPSQQAEAAPTAPAVELSLADQAREALALGDTSVALEKFGEALAETPDDTDLRWEYARALARDGDVGAAMREANKVLQQDPQRPGVNLQLADWMSERGSQPAVIAAYVEKERALDPGNVAVHKRLVALYSESGRQEDARKSLETWLELAPDDVEANLAMASIKFEEGDSAGAEAIYQKLAQADPTNADRMFYNAGAVIMNRPNLSMEDRKRAITAFNKALEVNPDHAKAHLQLGYALLGTGDREGAKSHMKRFVELEPNSKEAADAKGMIQALGG